jgi:hypothetical protein
MSFYNYYNSKKRNCLIKALGSALKPFQAFAFQHYYWIAKSWEEPKIIDISYLGNAMDFSVDSEIPLVTHMIE